MSRQRTVRAFTAALALMSVMFSRRRHGHTLRNRRRTPRRATPRARQTTRPTLDEQLRGLDQNTLRALIDALQRRLDTALRRSPRAASCTVDNGRCSVPAATAALSTAPAVTDSATTSVQPASGCRHHRQTTIVTRMESSSGRLPTDDKVPFLLKFNINTQLRYLNTQDSDETFTDHLGVAREVHTRNDITVNRAMFILGGYVFDQRARYSFTVWTSAGAASIVVASNIGWQFNKAITITAGYTGVPGSRSLVNTFPFFTATDRSMADNFFRPGFTQGVWANRRTRERAELSGVRRQRSQYPEYLGQQDRYASAAVRQCLVGTAGTLRGTRQITQHVR